jgi:hypothetical protein
MSYGCCRDALPCVSTTPITHNYIAAIPHAKAKGTETSVRCGSLPVCLHVRIRPLMHARHDCLHEQTVPLCGRKGWAPLPLCDIKICVFASLLLCDKTTAKSPKIHSNAPRPAHRVSYKHNAQPLRPRGRPHCAQARQH